jgi:hypothetical protein
LKQVSLQRESSEMGYSLIYCSLIKYKVHVSLSLEDT